MTFRYGQRHAIEIDAARRVAAALSACAIMSIVDIDLRTFGGSALTSDDRRSRRIATSTTCAAFPITYVPARNTIFLSFALAWAEVLGRGDIFIGVNALDYSGYPDCRPEYIAAFERMANLATRGGVEGTNPHSHPRRRSSISRKRRSFELGLSLGVDYAMTQSCYDPDPDGRGVRPLRRLSACGSRDSPRPVASDPTRVCG